MENIILGDFVLDSPFLTKLQAMHQSLSAGFHDQQLPAATSAHDHYVCASSSSVNDIYQLHDVVPLSTQQALSSHDIRLRPFDSSSTSPPSSLSAIIDDAALVKHNLVSNATTTSPCLSCGQEKGGQEEDPNTSCHSCATVLAQFLVSQGPFGCSLSSPYNTMAKHTQYDPSHVTSEDLSFMKDSFQRSEDNVLITSDVQDSNTSCSVNCMVNGNGHNPHTAALSMSTSPSTSSTPSSISTAQLAQLAKENLQAWMAYDTSSFSGKQSALMSNINSVSTADVGINKKRNGMSANSLEQKKRRRKRRRNISHKNVEEMETQRMTHIAVERNRRKQMNEHLRALRLLMPQHYIQRGDQASIVGGTIRFVEELQEVIQSLRFQKHLRAHRIEDYGAHVGQNHDLSEADVYEPYANTQSCVANVEVTMLTSSTIFLKVLAQKKPHQLLDTLLALSNLSLRVKNLKINTVGLIIIYFFNLEIDNSNCQPLTPRELAESIKHTLCA